MADLVAFLICFTTIFDDYEGKVKKYVTNVSMSQESGSMVLIEDETHGPIKSMMLEFPSALPEGQKAVLVEDTLSLAEKAMQTFHIPERSP